MKLPRISDRALLPVAFGLGFTVGLLVLWGVMLSNSKLMLPAPSPAGYYPPPSPVQLSERDDEPEATTTPMEPSLEGLPDMATTTDRLSLEVTWKTPKLVTLEQVLGGVIRATTEDESLRAQLLENVSSSASTFWELGTVRGGKYDGAHLMYWSSNNWCDMGGCQTYTILVSADRTRAWDLMNGSYDYSYYPEKTKYISSAPDLNIPSMAQPPSSIVLQSGKKLKQSIYAHGSVSYEDILKNGIEGSNMKIVAHLTDGTDVYSNGTGCLYIFGNDLMPYSYESVIPTKKADSGSYVEEAPRVTWLQGVDAGTEYIPYEIGGCGFRLCTAVLTQAQVGPQSSLKQIGTTVEGDPVYAPKDPASNQIVKEAYDSWVSYTTDDQKSPITEFLKQKPTPVYFWKDALGRWVRYIRSDALPAVECGKPVIYLYPEKTSRVSVKLPSFINVTVSEPLYPSNGWNVVAHPDGSLDYADGKTYGSLLWEGTGVGYSVPKEGFLLKDGEVDQRLTELLAKYGLNATESREFREFWVPKMTGAKYYRVSFLTSEWSKAAPLSVSPRPQTAIRIFMDWQKLNAPMSIAEPKIVTPSRSGFTLVEWGGLLRN